ncbi:MAG: protein kinase [bacterium]
MIGKTISHYQILEKLGEGGMGVVYKAEDINLKRTVALKFLPLQATGSREEKSRFVYEAQAAARLNHPNICTIYEIEESVGQSFISLEYIEGQTLKERIEAGPLRFEQALELAIQVIEGLQAAHKKGIIHRDIKSANIMLDENGKPKIMDFGLAKLAGRTQITKSGTTMGTVAYMSPEQARGQDVNHRTDIWSLGVVLYEMLTGSLPFKGDYDQAVVFSILNEDPVPMTHLLKDIPLELDRIVNKCLEKEPSKRYQTASELRDDIMSVMSDMGWLGSTTLRTMAPPHARRLRLNRKLTGIISGLMLLIVLGLLIRSDWRAVKNLLDFKGVPAQKHVLVLPFANVGDDPTNQAFSDGLVETLSSKLTQLERFQGSLWVVPASEVRRGGIESASEAQQTFGVNLVVSGSVQRIGDRFRLTLNLVDANTLRQLSSCVIDENRSNVSILQDESVIKIAEMLNVELRPETRRVLAEGGTTVPEAYEFYLQGLGYVQRYEKAENLDMAIDLFNRAIAQDSHYALAYGGLGEAYWRKYEISKDAQWVEHAVRNCERAVELNDLLAPVNVTLGLIHTGTGQYEEAIKKFQRALTLDPVSADAYRGLAKAYEAQGRLEEAELTYQKAIELKPDYWAGYNDLGVFYYRHGRYQDAIAPFRQIVELTPDNYRGYNNLGGIYYLLERWADAREMFERSFAIKESYRGCSNLGTLYYMEGRFADAARMYQKALDLNDLNYLVWGNLASAYYWTSSERAKAYDIYQRAAEMAEENRKVNPLDPEVLSHLVGYYTMLGDSVKAFQLIEKVLTIGPKSPNVMYLIGHAYEQLGERELALQWLGNALQNGHSLAEIEHEPGLRQLRSDARFEKLVENID